MKFKEEKGFTGVDIAISIVVIFIFVSIIAVLVYRSNSLSKEIELKSEATYIAINEIENVKNLGFEEYASRSIASGNSEVCKDEEIPENEGFFKTITVIDYTDLEGNSSKIPNLVKKVTVKISYMFKAQEQTVELSTVLSKES